MPQAVQIWRTNETIEDLPLVPVTATDRFRLRRELRAAARA